MGIWIKNQSGNLYEVICIERDRLDNQAITGTLSNDRTVLLGGYSSVKKANVVIDMIQDEIENNWEFAPIHDHMGTKMLKVGVNKVFKMPSDVSE